MLFRVLVASRTSRPGYLVGAAFLRGVEHHVKPNGPYHCQLGLEDFPPLSKRSDPQKGHAGGCATGACGFYPKVAGQGCSVLEVPVCLELVFACSPPLSFDCEPPWRCCSHGGLSRRPRKCVPSNLCAEFQLILVGEIAARCLDLCPVDDDTGQCMALQT